MSINCQLQSNQSHLKPAQYNQIVRHALRQFLFCRFGQQLHRHCTGAVSIYSSMQNNPSHTQGLFPEQPNAKYFNPRFEAVFIETIISQQRGKWAMGMPLCETTITICIKCVHWGNFSPSGQELHRHCPLLVGCRRRGLMESFVSILSFAQKTNSLCLHIIITI